MAMRYVMDLLDAQQAAKFQMFINVLEPMIQKESFTTVIVSRSVETEFMSLFLEKNVMTTIDKAGMDVVTYVSLNLNLHVTML